VESGDGHIINISSIFGLFAVPTQSAYNAAKFAVRGFTESLRMEMIANKRPVKVLCVHPGGIKTNIARKAEQVEGLDHDQLAKQFDKLARMSPAKAANVILKAVEKNKARVLIGADAWVLDKFVRLSGPGYARAVGAFSKRNGL
jgi:short-subunit dehydrogenase